MKLIELFPPSEPCQCEVCRSYCARPGWWTVKEFESVLLTPFYKRVMLEVAPEMTFGVLSPAFNGCENHFALQQFSKNKCCFFKNGLCELAEVQLMPLECRYCHHDRKGKGLDCHNAIEKEWHSAEGASLIESWMEKIRFPYKDYYRQILAESVMRR